MDKATGIIVTDLMYKHWDEWVTTAPHPFVADFDGKAISNPVDIMEGEPFESPMKPFGGIEQLAWNTTSDKIAYTSRKKTGKEYALSTNSDIYVYDLNTKETTNISEGIMGYDTNPQYSPDGKFIAWQSMERDGYESDQNRLMVMNLETGEKIFASKDFDSNVDGFVWSADAKALYFTGVWHGESQVYKIDLKDVGSDMRRKAKTANFGIIYGISVFGLAERMNVDRKEAKELIDGYFETYPGVKAYMDKSIQVAQEKGYVETIFHRKRFLPDINSRNAVVRGYAERNAINAPIQGSAADIIKVAMARIYQRFQAEGIQAKMILQVHDELNFSVPVNEKERVEEIVIEEMEKAYRMHVPLKADCGWGRNWLEAH